MTKEQIADLQQEISSRAELAMRPFIKQPITAVSAAVIRSHLNAVLKGLLDQERQDILEELRWAVSFRGSSVNIALYPMSDRATKFLLGEEFW